MACVQFVEFGNLEAAQSVIQQEQQYEWSLIQGENGIFRAMDSFLRGLREPCDETGTLLIFDKGEPAQQSLWNFPRDGFKERMEFSERWIHSFGDFEILLMRLELFCSLIR
ncbi:hypothetical protein KP509_32G040300 [Ceratopteris richardii]|uniref:Uncharacterized protein n=1 Tax=Ceratopteris richardii TaxID=49495 RepID=A0A8T2QTB5_CERRI|nr:hypothetical protein KP509_32G040300 [Ceratopteris richardii]